MACEHMVTATRYCTKYKCKCAGEVSCFSYKEDIIKHYPEDKKDGTVERPEYCKYCFNARIYEPTDEEIMSPYAIHLTDDNDSSSHSIGVYEKEKRFIISSGNGEPVRIEFEYWEPQWKQWLPIGKYYPKYCPECGRRLNEYDKKLEDN